MNPQDRFFAVIPAESLKTDPWEVAARLKVSRDFSLDAVGECDAELRRVLDCRYSAVRVPVLRPGEEQLDLGFGSFHSHDLTRNLTGCEEAFLFAVTVGHGADRLIRRLSVTSPARHFITDALASAYAEAACDVADRALRQGLRCATRFSPGYGDLPLTVQPGLLQAVNAERLLNITLGATLLMSPSKSITAVMGIQA